MSGPINFSLEIKPEELRQLDNNFDILKAELKNKITGDSIFKSSKIVLDAAQASAPTGSTGNMKASLARRRIVGEIGVIGSRVVSRRGKAFPHGYLTHLVEFGSRVVVRRRGGLYQIGHQPARAFLRPALVNNTGAVLSSLSYEMAIRVKRINFPRARRL